ncbi:unnamed protein product [Pneumocystis jirovecii]|uniref:G-patch domain-containing protein n=1 Tax=Pneumocystis jirovecii TaxID=42068 RepID=L0P752_PNEJI|nr:unnamed protein product [Pneumocystis jirovecii]
MTEKIALQFQPIRRPPQAKKNIKKTISSTSSSSTVSVQPHIVLQNVSSLDYWSHKDEDINESYDGTESRKAAKNRKKKKKIKDNEVEMILWDDPYDPFKPNDYEEYKMSDEAIQEMIDWKNKKEGKTNVDDTEKYKNIERFAPPASYSPQLSNTFPEDVTPINSIPSISLDETAEEAYARRVAMSQNRDIVINQSNYSSEPSYEKNTSILSLPSTIKNTNDQNTENLVSEAMDQPIDTFNDEEHTQTLINNITITREPQIYNTNTANTEETDFKESNYENLKNPESSEAQNNSNMPGQKKFAERLMKKYGWEKGKGLGASNDGIVNPLVVKHSKDRKGTGSIINKNRSYEKTGKFGKMSKVILLTNVSELETLDDDLSQEIGDECNKSYGKVERCFVYKNINSSLTSDIVRVFVLFTDAISALRAVNALDGRLFGGKEINVRFYDIDKFENGQYDA